MSETNEEKQPPFSPPLLGLFSVPDSSLFVDTLSGVRNVSADESLNPGSFIRGFFQQDKVLTPSETPPELSLDDNEVDLDAIDDNNNNNNNNNNLKSTGIPDSPQSPLHRPDEIQRMNSNTSINNEPVDDFEINPPNLELRGPSSIKKLKSQSPDESAKLRVVASRSNSVRGGPQVRLGIIADPTSFSPSTDDNDILGNDNGKNGSSGGVKNGLTISPIKSLGKGGSGGKGGGGLAARRGLLLNRTISDPVRLQGKSPTLRERMRNTNGGKGVGGGGGLVIDTKQAHANRFSSAWEGVRLKAPSAVRLRQTKAKSGEDSPTVHKLTSATKLCLKGLLLDLEQRRFAALARELIRRGYTPPPGVIDFNDDQNGGGKNNRKLKRSSQGASSSKRPSIMTQRRRSTATTLPKEVVAGIRGDGSNDVIMDKPAPRRSFMRSVFRSFSTRDLKQQTVSADGELTCTAPLLKWMTEVYSGEVLNLAAKDLVQSVVHVTSAADREKVKADMVVVLSEFEARLRCGLLNLTALVDTLAMLNLVPVSAAEAPMHSKYTSTLALLRQWSVGSLAVSHIALREVQRSQLQSLSPLQDASGDSESEEEKEVLFSRYNNPKNKTGDEKKQDIKPLSNREEEGKNTIKDKTVLEEDEEMLEKIKWGEELAPRASGVHFRSLSSSSAAFLGRTSPSTKPSSTSTTTTTTGDGAKDKGESSSPSSSSTSLSSSLSPASLSSMPTALTRSASASLAMVSPINTKDLIRRSNSGLSGIVDLDLKDSWNITGISGASGSSSNDTKKNTDGGNDDQGKSSVQGNKSEGEVNEIDLDASFDEATSLVDISGKPKGIPLDGGSSTPSNNTQPNSFENFFSAAAASVAAAVSVARQAVGNTIKEETSLSNSDHSSNHSNHSKLKIEVSPRRVRSLYEYVARFRARGIEEVSKHLKLKMQGSGSSLQNRLGMLNNRGSGRGRGGGGGILSPTSMYNNSGRKSLSNVPLRLEAVQHVWSIGDIHADFKENMAWITELPSHGNDALIITGNVAATLPVLHRALAKLRRRFKYVFYVFGNQDLWTVNFDGDSVEKFFAILDLCDSLGVVTTPALLGDDLAIVPLFSWYNVRSPTHSSGGGGMGASGSRPRASVSGGSRQRTSSWGDNRMRLSSDDGATTNDDNSASSGMMGGGYRYSDDNSRRRSSVSSLSSFGGGNEVNERRKSSFTDSSPRLLSSQRLWGNSGSACTPTKNLQNTIPFPGSPAAVSGGSNNDLNPLPIDSVQPVTDADFEIGCSVDTKGSTHDVVHGHRQFWYQLQVFRMIDAQCKWPLAIETAVPASAYRPAELDGEGLSSLEERGVFSAAAAAAVVSGASAFFHELNREAMGFDYGTRRVISASHFVPHDRLTKSRWHKNNSNGISTTLNNVGDGAIFSGAWPRPPPLTEEIERLNSTAHVYSGGGGEALSSVIALEGTCYMQHTIGYFNNKNFGEIQLPKREKDSIQGLRSSLPSFNSRTANSTSRERTKTNDKDDLRNSESSASNSGGKVASKNGGASDDFDFDSSTGNRASTGDVKTIPHAVTTEEPETEESLLRAQQVIATIRRLQLIWDDNYYFELTTIAAMEAVSMLKRGVPVVKHGRNRVAGGRTLYITVTHHNADGSAATSIPSTSPSLSSSSYSEANQDPLITYAGEERMKQHHKSHYRNVGQYGAASSSGHESDESDTSTITDVSKVHDEGGFIKCWLELGARRGSISGSTGTSDPKRLDLSHLRGVCVGRQTDTFRKSRRQPPPESSQQSPGAIGQGELGPGSADLCLSLIGGEGWAHRSVDLEFKSVIARDACLRFFRYYMRRLESRRGMGLLPPAAAAAAAAARASAIAAAASVASATQTRRRRSTFL